MDIYSPAVLNRVAKQYPAVTRPRLTQSLRSLGAEQITGRWLDEFRRKNRDAIETFRGQSAQASAAVTGCLFTRTMGIRSGSATR